MRRRILIGTVLLTIGTIAAFFVPAAIALSNAEREAQVVELQQEAMDATARLDPDSVRSTAEPTRGPDDAEVGVEADDDREHDYARYDADGNRVTGDGPAHADAPVLAAIAGSSTTGRVGDERVAAVPLADGGAVRAAEPASEADSRTRDAVLRLAAFGAVIVLIAGVAAWLLARRLTDPLRQLGQAASRMGGGDFTATAPHTGIVEIDEVADALNASATRIGELVERERRLTADTSHQLRTPIAGLRVALETELAAPRDDPTAVIAEALGAVDRLEATVDSLTDLARDASPADPFELRELTDGVTARWQSHYRAAGRSLRVERPAPGTSPTRQAAVDTIIDVLVENALAHGRGQVTVAIEARAGTALVTVSDEGACTIAADQLFERHESGSGSSGIGLHLARSLAEAEGARLRLASRAPTSFQLQLPIVDG
ncbi:MAG: sensor histidine kinase [Aquihabitans sp.]